MNAGTFHNDEYSLWLVSFCSYLLCSSFMDPCVLNRYNLVAIKFWIDALFLFLGAGIPFPCDYSALLQDEINEDVSCIDMSDHDKMETKVLFLYSVVAIVY